MIAYHTVSLHTWLLLWTMCAYGWPKIQLIMKIKSARKSFFYLNEWTADSTPRTTNDRMVISPHAASPFVEISNIKVLRANGARLVGSTKEKNETGQMCYILTKMKLPQSMLTIPRLQAKSGWSTTVLIK